MRAATVACTQIMGEMMGEFQIAGKRYLVELDEEAYIDLMRLVLKHPEEISLLTRTCVAYAKTAEA